MLRCLRPLLLTAIPVLLLTGELTGQEFSSQLLGQNYGVQYAKSHPGGYLSWIKLLLVVVVFVTWVRAADWINRDSMKIGELTNLFPEIWNPIGLGSFFVGFLVVIFVPIFYVGYPLYVVGAIVPPLVYFFMRRAAIKAEPNILDQVKSKPGETVAGPLLPQDEGAAVEFSAAGEGEQQQVHLIRARQSPGFPVLKNVIAEAVFKRADVILLDYTRDRVNCRMQVDGVWHPSPPMDRETGDAVLVSLKNLAGANPTERRARQSGQFSFKTENDKADIELLSQGVPTGERAQLKFKRMSKHILTLSQLGMFPDMVNNLKSSLNRPGLAIVSAPPGEGLTTSWRGTLVTADRLTRDCVAIIDKDETESVVENVVVHRFDSKGGKKQFDVLKAMLLSQPNFIVAPIVEDKETMDLLAAQITTQDRSVLLRTSAKSAAEALLRVYSQCGDRDLFANSVKHVTCQRLLRRLCDECKQEVRVAPKLIEKLGGNPRQQQSVFNQYKLPPPEQRVDEKGNPIEFPPCPVCGGIGYIGRIAVFEMIEVNDQVRIALRQSPKAAAIEQAALKAGKKPLVNQAYQLVLLGITSVAEVQRVFKQ